eukprot:COSAG03_NODE_1348_length_4281_cov_116.671927_3_plen_494_part_00
MPLLRTIVEFCNDVGGWLASGEDGKGHVAAIHCKAGKGRTGLMIVCFLCYIGRYHGPHAVEQALEFYGETRTEDGQGVTIPCQQRYCRYFARALADASYPERLLAPPPAFYLRAIRILSAPPPQSEQHSVPHIGALKEGGKYQPVFEIHCEHQLEADYPGHKDSSRAFYVSRPGVGELRIDANVRLAGGVKLELFKEKDKGKAVFYCCFHTTFLEPDVHGDATLLLHKQELSKPHKDVNKNEKFSAGFCVLLEFAPCRASESPRPDAAGGDLDLAGCAAAGGGAAGRARQLLAVETTMFRQMRHLHVGAERGRHALGHFRAVGRAVAATHLLAGLASPSPAPAAAAPAAAAPPVTSQPAGMPSGSASALRGGGGAPPQDRQPLLQQYHEQPPLAGSSRRLPPPMVFSQSGSSGRPGTGPPPSAGASGTAVSAAFTGAAADPAGRRVQPKRTPSARSGMDAVPPSPRTNSGQPVHCPCLSVFVSALLMCVDRSR